MKKLFVSYEIAIQLRDKGFIEPCLAWFYNDDNPILIESGELENCNNKEDLIIAGCDYKNSCSAPIFQQAIEWFKDKHKIYIYIVPSPYENKVLHHITYKDETDCWCDGEAKDLNEAVETALKLIK